MKQTLKSADDLREAIVDFKRRLRSVECLLIEKDGGYAIAMMLNTNLISLNITEGVQVIELSPITLVELFDEFDKASAQLKSEAEIETP